MRRRNKRRMLTTCAQKVLIYWISLLVVLHRVSSWSLNNFLMTGPKAYLVFSESVAAGVQIGVEECQYQFRWDRWNCPMNMMPFYRHSAPVSANRETSFMHAISAAAVMYTLTRNCSLGDFEKCGCDNTKNGQTGGANWKWGGCSDNVVFGEMVSRQFVDALETGKDARATVNLHNNEAGRQSVRKTLRKMCKCHGVSGSCTTKTCWKQLPEFRTIGDYLKRKYIKSVMVDFQNGELHEGNVARNPEFPSNSIASTDLVYLEKSPNYCESNTTEGSHGLDGRECIRPKRGSRSTRWERKSCKRLCHACGLRVQKRNVKVVKSCNCKFHWCCAVRCEQCVEEVEKLTCKR